MSAEVEKAVYERASATVKLGGVEVLRSIRRTEATMFFSFFSVAANASKPSCFAGSYRTVAFFSSAWIARS